MNEHPATKSPKNEAFVGRKILLDEILDSLVSSPPKTSRHHISGILGLGKSSFLERLRALAQERGVRVSIIDAEIDIDPAHHGEVGDKASVTGLQANFQALAEFLRQLVDDLQIGSVGELEAIIAKSKGLVIEAGSADMNINVEQRQHVESGGTLTASGLSTEVRATAFMADRWRKAAQSLIIDFTGWLRDQSPSDESLILIDNIDRLAATEVYAWMQDLLAGMPRSTIVFAGDPSEPPPAATRTISLPYLSFEDVQLYLHLRFAGQVPAEWPARAYKFSAGHPLALGLLYDLTAQDESGILSEIVDEAVERLQTDDDGRLAGLNDRMAELVSAMLSRLERRNLNIVLQTASIPRQFDTPLLKALLNDDSIDAPNAVRDLEMKFSFVQKVQTGSSKSAALSVHSFVRTGISERMQRYDPENFQKLHRRAAEFHYANIVDVDGYGDWFELEKKHRQHSLREWLYHLGHCGDEVATRLRFTKIFCDCMWWWRNYVPMDFCDELVDDLHSLAETVGSKALRSLADSMSLVLEAYPLRSIKTHDADWGAVRKAFLRMLGYCGLSDDGSIDTDDKRHVAALINIFLAHASRYATLLSPEALRRYDNALRYFTQNGDNGDLWNMAWVSFEKADVFGDARNVDVARHMSVEAGEAVYKAYAAETGDVKYLDHELVANIHRLRGDCHTERGDYRLAARSYGAAVLHAYEFHTTGGPPDAYTHQFYVEIRGRALTPAIVLNRAGRTDEAVEFCRILRASLPSSWAEPLGDVRQLLDQDAIVELALTIFPRNPDWNELGLDDSEFMDEWNEIHSGYDGSANQDLRALL